MYSTPPSRLGFRHTLTATGVTKALLHRRLYMLGLVSVASLAASPSQAADCNENGIDDAQDIAALTSRDCDGNGTPDECQIKFNSPAPGGPFFCIAGCDRDCNKSGTPDACELADNDCNANNVPDACEVRDRLIGMNNASTFEVDQETGEARPIERTRFGGHSFAGLAYDPDSGILYGADAVTNELVLVDPATGQMSVVGGLDFAVAGMDFDPNTHTLYGVDDFGHVGTINPRTAEMQIIATLPLVSIFSHASGLAFNSLNNMLFAAKSYEGNRYLLSVDPKTGQVEIITGSPTQLDGLTFDADRNALFGTTANCLSMTRFDADTGRPVSFSFLDSDVYGLTSDASTGMFFGAGTDAEQLVRIDPAPVAGEFVALISNPSVVAIELDPISGVLYGLDDDLQQLVTIDPETGTILPVAPLEFRVPYLQGAAPLAFDPNRDFLYTVAFINNSWQLVTIDPSTGAQTVVGPTIPASGFAFDWEHDILYGEYGDDICTIDISTGDFQRISLHGVERDYYDLAYDPASDMLFAISNSVSPGIVLIDPQSREAVEVRPCLPTSRTVSLTFDPSSGTILGKGDWLVRIHAEALSNSVDTIVQSTGFGNARAMTFGRDNGLYAIDNAAHLRRIALDTGLSTIIGPVGFSGIDSLAYDGENDVLYAVDDQTDRLTRIDQTTGVGTAVGPLGFKKVLSLAFDEGAGMLFGIDADTRKLVRINPQTGVANAVGTFGTTPVIDLVIAPNSDGLWAVSYKDGGQIIEVNRNTGQGTLVSTALLGSSQYGAVATDPLTGILYWSDGKELMTIDPANGQVTALGTGFPPWVAGGVIGGVAFIPDTHTLIATEFSRSQSFLLNIDLATGSRTRYARVSPIVGEASIAWDPLSRTLYSVDDQIFLTIDPLTGAENQIATFPGVTSTQALAYDTDGGILYAIDLISRTLMTIDTATGATHLIGQNVAVDEIPSLAFDSNARTLYGVEMGASGTLINIDPATGFGEEQGPTQYRNIRALDFLEADCNENLIPDDCEGDFDGDGLLDACEPADCGDGVLSAGEQCDNGAANSDTAPDACRTDCLLPSCGDGVIDSIEQCDAGGANSDSLPDACRTDCHTAYCGDGVVDSAEQCDGNNTPCPGLCAADCSCAPAIPTVSAWGLAVLGLLLLVIGKVSFGAAKSSPTR